MDPAQVAALFLVIGVLLMFLGSKMFGTDYKSLLDESEENREKDASAFSDNFRVLNAQVEELTSLNAGLNNRVEELSNLNQDLSDNNTILLELNLMLAMNHLDFTKAYTEHIIGDKEAAYAFILHLEKGDVSDTKKLEMLRTLTDDMAVITNGTEEDLNELIDPNVEKFEDIENILEENDEIISSMHDENISGQTEIEQIEEAAKLEETTSDEHSCDTCEQTDEEKEKSFNANREKVMQEEDKTDEGSTSEDVKKSGDDNNHH